MVAPNFSGLLQKPADEIKKPVALPAGTYFGITKSREYGESKEKKTPFVRYTVGVNGPGEDTKEVVAELGIDVTKKSLRKDFYITTDSEYRIIEFAKSCQVPTAGRSLGEVIEDTLNQQVMMTVKQRIDGEDIYNDIDKIVGLE